MKRFYGIILCVFIIFSSYAENPSKESFHLFLLMGQSNMAGFGDILPEDKTPIDGVLMLRDTLKKGEEFCWIEAKQPIHARLSSDRYCLAGPFAQAYHTMYPKSVVGLIPMGWGGAAITQMEKGTIFYEEVIKKTLWAKQQGQLKAILWHQGESDTVTPEDAELYEQRLKKLIYDLRIDLKEPDLPFIIGDLAEFYGTGKEHCTPDRVERINKLRNALKKISQNVPHTGFVSTKDLRSHDHYQVHFDRNSYIRLGYRYFDTYLNIK